MYLPLNSVENFATYHKLGRVKYPLLNMVIYLAVVVAMVILWPAGVAVAQGSNFTATDSSRGQGLTPFASAGGSGSAGGFSMWATPVYQNHRGSDLKSDELTLNNFQLGRFQLGPLPIGPLTLGDLPLGDLKYGYDTDLYGVSLGADYTTFNDLHLGISFNIGGGKSDTTGDLAGIRNDFDYYGLNLYTGYSFNNFSLHADLGYTVSTNDMNMNMGMGLEFDNPIPLTINANAKAKAEADSQLFTAGLRGEYLLATDSLDITPYLGVRVNYLRIDDYNTRGHLSDINLGLLPLPGSVIPFNYITPETSTTMVQFPVGITLGKSFKTQSGLSIRPDLDLGVLFTIGDDNFIENIAIPGIATSVGMDSGIHDDITLQGGLGIAISYNDNLSLDLDYKLNYSEHLTNSGVLATLGYKF